MQCVLHIWFLSLSLMSVSCLHGIAWIFVVVVAEQHVTVWTYRSLFILSPVGYFTVFGYYEQSYLASSFFFCFWWFNFFLIEFIFLEKFWVHSKIKWKVGNFHTRPFSTQSQPTINIPHQSGAFVIIDEPILTHHYHPKSIVYLRVHSWCCIFCGFCQVYNEIYPLL